MYSKLIINGVQCSICSKVFETRRNVNQHIGHQHKEKFSEIKQKMNLDLPTKTLAKPGLEISTGQNAGIQDNQIPKGQLILRCPYGVFKSSKKTNDIFSRISV